MKIRDMRAEDHPEVLALNEESVAVLSALNAEKLARMVGDSDCAWVATANDPSTSGADNVVAFLIAFREGASYEGIHYRWFADRFERFLYLDRIVVAIHAQGQGVGTRLYEALFEHAKSSAVETVACEIDVDPPNAGSARFHARFGFSEVERQPVLNGSKVVSLQVSRVNSG